LATVSPQPWREIDAHGLHLRTLESRRVRGDLIEVFKIINVCGDVNYRDYFVVSNTGLRAHEFKLFKADLILQ